MAGRLGGFLAILSVLGLAGGGAMAQTPAAPQLGADDPYIWLEDIEGTKALDWVKERNAKSLKVLEAHPSYAGNLTDITTILTAKDRIPMGTLRKGLVYNHWQDEKNQRGLWRRAPLAEYVKADPAWEVLLDVDALGKAEKESWVWKGAECLAPAFERCMLRLSRGGTDASVEREFDLKTRSFVQDGFFVPEAKSNVSWAGPDVLLVGTDWGAGSLTESGYPRIVKLHKRGEKLGSGATVFEGRKDDVWVAPFVDIAPDGRINRFIVRGIDFFTADYYWLDEKDQAQRIPVPVSAESQGLFQGFMLFSLRKDWVRGSETIPQGSLIAISLDAFVKNPNAEPKVTVLLTPDARSALNGVSVSKDAVYVGLLENVIGRVERFTLEGGSFKRSRVALPDNGAIDFATASSFDSEIMLTYKGFDRPDQLFVVDRSSAPKVIKTLPARFNADGLEVKQFEATAKDGVKVPYFLVRKASLPLDGAIPTLLYAYGGFEISMTPWYWASAGKAWLEKGGAVAVANIRGGGEFGPKWHAAAKDGKRDVAFDDFASVAQDLITRKVTSPRRIGIMGGSNGGLLVGAAMVRNPALFNAVVCQVPLLDMIRYTLLSAGPSWAAEYGDPKDPKMKALIETWSPYQNLKKGVTYPRMFLMTSTKDDRVHPGHARKFGAKMEEFGQPYFYYENIEGGHSAAADLAQRAKQQALVFTYLRLQLMD